MYLRVQNTFLHTDNKKQCSIDLKSQKSERLYLNAKIQCVLCIINGNMSVRVYTSHCMEIDRDDLHLYLTIRDIIKISKTKKKNHKILKLPMRCQNCILSDKYFKSGAKFQETGAKFHETGAKTAHRVPNSTKRGPEFYWVTKVSGCHYLVLGLLS